MPKPWVIPHSCWPSVGYLTCRTPWYSWSIRENWTIPYVKEQKAPLFLMAIVNPWTTGRLWPIGVIWYIWVYGGPRVGTPPVGTPLLHVPVPSTSPPHWYTSNRVVRWVGLRVQADRRGLDSQDRQIVLPENNIFIYRIIDLAHEMTDVESSRDILSVE